MSAPFQIFVAPWQQYAPHLQMIRTEVFMQEQQVPAELEWDGLDAAAGTYHLLAVDAQGEPVGTARLLATGQIGRMAVRAPWRHQGVGRELLQAALSLARQLGFRQVHLHAQTHAAGFYARAGFRPYGEEFLDAGIPHIAMARDLPGA
jgi:predicted GNAT family N-acyltransferase